MIFLQLTEAERCYAADLADPEVRQAKQAITFPFGIHSECHACLLHLCYPRTICFAVVPLTWYVAQAPDASPGLFADSPHVTSILNLLVGSVPAGERPGFIATLTAGSTAVSSGDGPAAAGISGEVLQGSLLAPTHIASDAAAHSAEEEQHVEVCCLPNNSRTFHVFHGMIWNVHSLFWILAVLFRNCCVTHGIVCRSMRSTPLPQMAQLRPC